MAVRNLPISSSFLIPFRAIFAERVPLGITTPSNTMSAALLFRLPAIIVPFSGQILSADKARRHNAAKKPAHTTEMFHNH
jgi:hypothetical protein